MLQRARGGYLASVALERAGTRFARKKNGGRRAGKDREKRFGYCESDFGNGARKSCSEEEHLASGREWNRA